MIKTRLLHILEKLGPWVVTIGILIYLFHQTTITSVIEAATHVNLWIFVPTLIVGIILHFLWDVFVYNFLFREVGIKVSYLEMLMVRGSAHLLTIVNYFVGAGSIALLMNRLKKIPISKTGSVVIFKLFLDYYMILALCLLTSFYLPGVDLKLFFVDSDGGNLVRLIILSWICFVAVLVFFHVVLPRIDGFKKIKKNKFLFAFRNIQPQKYLIFILVQVTGFFFFDILIVFFALMIFKLYIPFLLFITLFPIVRLVAAIPISIMGLGTSQMAMIWLFAPLVSDSAGKSDFTVSILSFSLLVTIISSIGRFLIGALSIRVLPENVWRLTK